MNRLVAGVILTAVVTLGARAEDSTDALVVVTTTGFLTGAADGCRVAADESNELASAMSMAISGGKYGDQAEALTEFNRARQRGSADAAAGKVDCDKIADTIRSYLTSLRSQ
jgi:hypothetical protein